MEEHKHAQAPQNPKDGEKFICGCGYSAEYVVLDGVGEWIGTSSV